MEVKGISPVAAAPTRREAASGAAPLTARAADPLPKSDDRARTASDELKGPLAQKLLESSGIKPAEIDRYRIKLDIDDDTGRVVAEIRHKETDELVDEVPSRTLLRQAAMLKEALGTLLDTPV